MKIASLTKLFAAINTIQNVSGFTLRPHWQHSKFGLMDVSESEKTQAKKILSRFTSLNNNSNNIVLDQVSDDGKIEETDIIVIGSGFGGLSCAALTSKYKLKTICVEAHDTPGGVAHSFSRYNSKANANGERVPFRFDSGPSLISGLSSKSTNPLRQVLDAIGVEDDIDWCTYDGWIVYDYADNTKFRRTALSFEK